MAKKTKGAEGEKLPAIGRIVCPACKSEISSDGAELFKRSDSVEQLEEMRKGLPELEKEIKRLEAEIQALAAENTRLKEEAKKHVASVAKDDDGETDSFGFAKR